MAKFLKILLIGVGVIVGLGVLAAVALLVFFDPNDFREEISAKVTEATGREFAIEGELSVSLFPWLAVEVGRTRLGNAEGFGDEPFATFDSARLSVEVLPLLLRREISIGAVALEGLTANLAVAADGTTNWDDLGGDAEAAEAPPAGDEPAGAVRFDVASVRLGDATVSYSDRAAGATYTLDGLTVETGAVALGSPVDVDARFGFTAQPGELGGELSISGRVTVSETIDAVDLEGLSVAGTVRGLAPDPTDVRLESRAMRLDLAGQSVSPGEIDLGVLGLAMSADVEPFSYAGRPEIVAALRVNDFSLKDLLARLAIEPPVTADPNALQKVSFSARATVGEEAIALDGMTLVLDDTTLTGTLGVPLTEAGFLTFDLAADSINVDNYMAPAAEGEVAETEGAPADVDIPVDLVRALRARGSLSLAEAFLGPVTFTNLELGVNGADGRLRLNPISADFFDGNYSGDVRIDASGSVPSLSVDETISAVNLKPMAEAMFDTGNVTGTIDGRFRLAGSGERLSAIRRDLDGEMAIELKDGAWQGVDVWHQLRTARALYKRESMPEPQLPARTEFSNVRLTGVVADGVFASNDLRVEMPFLRITGGGTVDLATAEIDYSVQARVLERPEFMADASDEELADFTEAVVPILVRGPLADPTFRPDMEAIFRARVDEAVDEQKERLRERVMTELFGAEESAEGAAGEGADTGAEDEPEEEQDPEEQLKDELKDRLKDLFPR